MREFWSKARSALWRRRGVDNDIDEEVRSHLDLMIEDHIAGGLSPEQAESASRRLFGNQTAVKERAREAWQFPRIGIILRDLRSGVRSIRRSPVFSLIVILTLALGIGANTAVFSVVDTVLLRPPPYPQGERLVEVWEAAASQNIPVSWINFQHWRLENRTFEDLAGFETADLPLTGRGEALLTHACVVSANFFRLTGWRPLKGRLFTAADDTPGAAPTVVLTSEFSERLPGGRQALGSTLTLDGKAFQVIGVLPPGLNFFARPVDFYLPSGPRNGAALKRTDHRSMLLLGLLKPGETIAGARTDLNAIMHRLALSDPGPEDDHRASISWLSGVGVDDIRPALLMLMSAAGLVLIIACANVAGLLLARSAARVREMAIRAAIGASRNRLARQLLTENFVITALGGAIGLLLAELCLRLLALTGPQDIPRLADAGLNLPVLWFAAALTVITGLLAGLAPVFDMRKVDLSVALKEGSPAAGAGARRNSLRAGLVVAEIAVTLVLSFACGLLLRSLILAQTSYPGFNPAGLLALELQLPPSRYKSDDAVRHFYARLADGLLRQPGVESVGAVNCPPSTGGCAKGWYSIMGMPTPARSDVPLAFLSSVDLEYFRTMGMRLLAGRGFTDADRAGAPRVAVINEKLARAWWPSDLQLAVGHSLKFGGPYQAGPAYQIIGVVNNVSQAGLDTPAAPEIHVVFAQSPTPAMVLMIRAAGDPANLIRGVRRELSSIDPNMPIQSLRPFERWIGAALARRRFSTVLLGIFTVLAVTLSAVGIYGTLSYWVETRQKEIAVRLALGARRREILRWVSWQAARLVVSGIALGMFSCWGASHWLKSMVFGLSSQNPPILLLAIAGVIAAAGLAAGIPIWRATRVDAIRGLRDA